jgi:ATP-binding cassette, subfamily B, bacterial
MLSRLTARDEWQFFGILPRADRGLTYGWWAVLVMRGLLPPCSPSPWAR